ncbi:MBOAT family protein [bacterium]|nr:MBOAT family protein [candidate division CSSED10-310 bacterium]
MVFSSPAFLFAFLPVVLAAYFIARPAWRNMVLLAFSLLFYACGETVYTLLMLVSITCNYLAARIIRQTDSPQFRKRIVIAGITGNLLMLGYFKYAGFIMQNLYQAGFPLFGTAGPPQDIHLPIGISFFTFQAMSYLIDIYRGGTLRSVRFIDCAVYISLFPQLIAGPILRYHQIAEQIRSRSISRQIFSRGIQRFIIGLGKKVLLADSAGFIADTLFAEPSTHVSVLMAWLGVLAYALQIYFDFSGYSDMAIGLGRLFGFEFPENFNTPYISRSIREFWQRWHISLSTWFRDYLYIPLGGNRLGPRRTYVNLWIVFVLCGLWHGAGWNFIAWGVLHGLYLVMERLGGGRWLIRLWRPLQHVYVLVLVLIGWVFFRTENLTAAGSWLLRMAGVPAEYAMRSSALAAFDPGRLSLLAFGIVFCLPIGRWCATRMDRIRAHETARWKPAVVDWVMTGSLIGLFLLCTAVVASTTYQPFIYFRF